MRFMLMLLIVFLTACTEKESTQAKQTPEVERMIAQAKSTWQVGQCVLKTFLEQGVIVSSSQTMEYVPQTNKYEKSKKITGDADPSRCPKGSQIIAPIGYQVRKGVNDKDEHWTLLACYGDCQYASPPSVEGSL